MSEKEILQEIESKKILFKYYKDLTEEQMIFLYCYSFKQIKFKEIEEVLKSRFPEKKYEDVQRLNEECKEYRTDIQSIREKFNSTNERKEGFGGNFENFYIWYKKQDKKCFYCGVTAETLQSLFKSKKLSSTKFNATLHIERLKPKEPYSPENTKLACSLCNNAKSDLISQENYEKYFAESMTNFLKDLDSGKIENKID